MRNLIAPIVFLWAGFAALVWTLLIQRHVGRHAGTQERKRLIVPLAVAAFCVVAALLLLLLNRPT